MTLEQIKENLPRSAQAELGRRFNVSPSYVSATLQGKYDSLHSKRVITAARKLAEQHERKRIGNLLRTTIAELTDEELADWLAPFYLAQ